MAKKKKFFNDKVYNSRRTLINIIIICSCIIGIILCFIITSNFQATDLRKPDGIVNIKNEVVVEINENYSNEIFFSKLENININDIKISYSDDFDISKIGTYLVTININDTDYNSNIKVIDTTAPVLNTKDVTIYENESYKATDFVSNCNDNSNSNCNISFANGIDQDGKKINYSNYKKNGIYTIKISAKDPSGNVSTSEAKLTINKKSNTSTPVTPPISEVCKYGSDTYDTNKYVVTVFITANHCAVSLDLYNSNITMQEVNSIISAESLKIAKDISSLNLTGTLTVNGQVNVVKNSTGNGVIGYEVIMTATLTNNSKSSIIAEYKIDNKGKRLFVNNPYNLK